MIMIRIFCCHLTTTTTTTKSRFTRKNEWMKNSFSFPLLHHNILSMFDSITMNDIFIFIIIFLYFITVLWEFSLSLFSCFFLLLFFSNIILHFTFNIFSLFIRTHIKRTRAKSQQQQQQHQLAIQKNPKNLVCLNSQFFLETGFSAVVCIHKHIHTTQSSVCRHF